MRVFAMITAAAAFSADPAVGSDLDLLSQTQPFSSSSFFVEFDVVVGKEAGRLESFVVEVRQSSWASRT